MPIPHLNPVQRHPLSDAAGAPMLEMVFLNQVIDHPRMEIGDFTYAYSNPAPQDWAKALAPYLFDDDSDRLIIGKFGHFAQGATFLTAVAESVHPMDALSTYPFRLMDPATIDDYSARTETRDILVGHDVWLGFRATVMPGIAIGHGAIVGAGAIVTKDVAPYTIVAGVPARPLRQRFDEATVDALLEIGWWDWEVDRIRRGLPAIEAGDVEALRRT